MNMFPSRSNIKWLKWRTKTSDDCDGACGHHCWEGGTTQNMPQSNLNFCAVLPFYTFLRVSNSIFQLIGGWLIII